jgi:putative membrane protein
VEAPPFDICGITGWKAALKTGRKPDSGKHSLRRFVMTQFLIRLGINVVGLYAAIRIFPIQAENTTWVGILVLAVIFGLVNALVAPILKFFTCPFILVTLGLFVLIINTFLFWLTGAIGYLFGFGFTANFIYLFLGALVVAIINVLLSAVFKDQLKG